MQLRKYQNEAVSSALKHLAAGDNPVLQLATGTGKSLIISALAESYRSQNKQVWALTHVQQLVSQNVITYERFAGVNPAVVCAGLGRKDTHGGVMFGTIQTVINIVDKLKEPDLIIIDEAHRVPHNEGEPSMYESILAQFPAARRVAMTATPWRMDNGTIYGEGDQFWFNRLAFNYTVPKAVAEGWLCPLVGVETAIQLNVDDVSVKGDFVQTEVEEAQTLAWLTSVANSINKLAAKRNHIAVYCPTIKSARNTAQIISSITGWKTVVLASDMSDDDRAETLNEFYIGQARVLCSVDMITTGFDFPALDCIVCLRPTLSSSLWVQIQGRGTRLHNSKKNCLVLDYAGNLIRLGGVDMYETFYRERGGVQVEAVARKPYVKKERKLHPGLTSLSPIDPMTGEEAKDGSEMIVNVHNLTCVAMATRNNPNVPLLMVQYICTTPENARINATKFINTERVTKATTEFFKNRSLAIVLPAPARNIMWSVKNARCPFAVTVRKKGKYWNVLEEHWV